MFNQDLAWRIEGACFKAWPALHEKILDGWLLRFAQGLTRRANSANPLRGAPNDSDALIASCEAEYRERHLPVYFRIPSIIGPAMPKRLDRLGYQTEGESLVLYSNLYDAAARENAAVAITPELTEEWLAAMARLQRHEEVKSAVYRQVVASIKAPTTFASVSHKDGIVALAYGVLHDRLLCLESVITDEAFRGKGHARRMLNALFAHTRRSATTGLCLQVQADNAPAVALYKSLGLKDLYRYHYQRKNLN